MTMWDHERDHEAWQPTLGSGAPRYLAIVDSLASDIRSGCLIAGARLPTHRELADRLGLSVGTVTRAFTTAEQRGLIHGVIGRGTFVGPPAPERFASVDPGPTGFVDLSRTWPLNTLDPDLAPVLRSVAKDAGRAELLHYQDNAGMARHRQAGVDWAARFGLDTKVDSVVLCSGVQHAISVALATVARPNDWVLTEALTYPGLKAAATMQNQRVLGLEMDEEGIVPAAFASACRQRGAKVLYCTPTLQNPTTATMSLRRREQIAQVAREHDVSIIEDDIHQLLADERLAPIASLAPERTFFIAGMSKTVTGALRIAYLVVPDALVDRVAENVWASVWMVPPLTAEIAARWIADGTADATVERKRVEALARLKLAQEVLGEGSFRSAPAAYHVWLPLPPPWDSARFVAAATRAGVGVTDQAAFATESGGAVQAVRICLSAPDDRESLKLGLQRVRELLDRPPGPGRPVL